MLAVDCTLNILSKYFSSLIQFMSNLETTNKNLAITAGELKTSLEAKDKPIVFDLGDMRRYEAQAYPWFCVRRV